MSASLRSDSCEKDMSYCKFGNEALSKLLQVFESQIGGVLEAVDIEYVHKMRVSSRRIRASIPLFRTCFPRKKFKKWLSEIKNVTRLLGEARDLDVQIAFVQSYLQKWNSPTESSSLASLLKVHEDRRKSVQPNVIGGLEELQSSGVLEEMDEFFNQRPIDLSGGPFNVSSVLEKAYWHISSKLSEFLALEDCVHDETAFLRHHEMRIKAKWLRYTMETFAPLYVDKLADDIQTIKDFQDVLGEMHDCDVWVAYIPKFLSESEIKGSLQKTKEQNQATAGDKMAVLKFLDYIKDTKKNYYNNFVQLWDQKKETKFFDNLREKAGAGFAMSESRLGQTLSSPNVKIAVLSDVHANLHALEAVIQDAEKRGADVFLNAGDSVGFGAYPNEVIQLLHSKNVVSVAGNFDLEVVKGEVKGKGAKKIAVEFARKELTKSCEAYLISVHSEISLNVAEKKLLMVHGSPESIEEHIYHDTPVARLKELADKVNVDLMIVGHSHEQFHRQVGNVSFLNPGSVGRPGDGNPQTAYALLSFNPFNVELIRLDYDVKAAADGLRRKGLPESFAQMFLRGISLEDIIKEDKSREGDMIQHCEKLSQVSRDLLKDYLRDPKHSEHVRNLALSFYDGLSRLHQLGQQERCWLECAAILHDIGLSEGASGHHKKSMTLILNDMRLPFASDERRVVASIAQVPQKGSPQTETV